jgi:hypothetical protein
MKTVRETFKKNYLDTLANSIINRELVNYLKQYKILQADQPQKLEALSESFNQLREELSHYARASLPTLDPSSFY